MKAVILAAGKGTRMKHLTQERPKPLIEVGKRNILEYILCAIRDAGIRDFVVVTGHFANLIEDHFGDGAKFDMHVEYVRQKELDGTGSALRICREAVGDEPFFMSFGDIMTSLENYSQLINQYRERPCDLLLSLAHVDDPCRGAAVYVDEQLNIERIIEKPAPGTSTTNWNNAGVFVFSPKIFDYLERVELSPRGEYEIVDAFTMMMDEGLAVRAFILEGMWGDIGTPGDVERMTRFFEEQDR